MKKFLIFLVAIVVCVCVGVTGYYFLRNDEVIRLEKSAIEINIDDYIRKDGTFHNSLGLNVTQKNKRTKYGYRVEDTNGRDLTSSDVITYDAEQDVYIPHAGGEYVLIITTSNKKFPEFRVNVHVGDGLTEENPYFIRNADQFYKIANNLKWHYKLIENIKIADDKFIAGEFTGSLDGNYKAITGLNITKGTNASLFETIASGAVKNLIIDSPIINGSFGKAAALAGEIRGTAAVYGVQVKNATITNTNTNGTTAGLIANANEGTKVMLSYVNGTIALGAKPVETPTEPETPAEPAAQADEVVGTPVVGGLVGLLDKAIIKASYAQVSVTANETINYITAGGLVGKVVLAPSKTTDYANVLGMIHQSYAVVSNNASVAPFAGSVTAAEKIVAKTKDSGGDANAYTYVYFVGNYAKNNGQVTTTDNIVGNFDANTEAVKNLLTENDAITIVPIADNNTYLYYKNIEWDRDIWNVSTQYPTLKLDADRVLSQSNVDDKLKVATNYIQSTMIIEKPIDNTATADTIIGYFKSNSATRLTGEAQEFDFTSVETDKWDLDNMILEGNGSTIIVNNSLFNTLKNSAISNIKVKVNSVSTTNETYGGLVNRIESNTTVDGVTVEYVVDRIQNTTIKTFGGVVGMAIDSSVLNCSAKNINLATTLAAVDNVIPASTIGGVVGSTNSSVSVSESVVEFNSLNTNSPVTFGGIVGNSTGSISGAGKDASIYVNIVNVAQGSKIAGVTGVNGSVISNIKLVGNGIRYATTMSATEVYFAGVAVDNNGSINNVYNYMANIGGGENSTSFATGKDYKVAGLAWNNSTDNSAIYQCIVATNLYGNYVAGIVGEQGGVDDGCKSNEGSTNASVKQVLVAGANWNKDVLYGSAENPAYNEGANILRGDKFVAGVAYTIARGSVINIQTNSIIEAASTGTRASLIVFHFPEGAVLNNAVINSQFTGNVGAAYYRDTWWNNNKINTGGVCYNLYGNSGYSGTMGSVVINTQTMRSGLSNVDDQTDNSQNDNDSFGHFTQSKFMAGGIVWLGTYNVGYEDGGNSGNYILETNSENFANSATFVTEFTLQSNSKANTLNYGKTVGFGTRKLNFTPSNDGIWVNGGNGNFGIVLNFVNALQTVA